MDAVKLPIDLIPNTNPPTFRWRQTVSTMDGTGHAVQDCEGQLPSSVETAVAKLIQMCKEAMKDCAMLRGQVEAMNMRAGAQAKVEPSASVPVTVLQSPPHPQNIAPKKVRG